MTTQRRITPAGTLILGRRAAMLACGFLLLGLLPAISLAQPGELDLSFGTDGIVTTDFGSMGAPTIDWGTAVDVQPNGKIVMAGFFGFFDSKYALARYNADGSLDTGFSMDGKDIIDFGAGGAPEAVVVLPNGEIVVAGSAGDDFALAKYNKDGSLDTEFGTNGLVTTDFGAHDKAWDAVVQPNGKIVVAGTTCGDVSACVDDEWDFALAKYNKDGSLDTEFGTNGLVTTDFFGYEDQAFAVAVRPTGEIVVAGVACLAGNGEEDEPPQCAHGEVSRDIALAKFNADGTPDSGFGTDGIVTTDFAFSDVVESVSIQPNGKIVVAGGFTVERYNADGSLDTEFGTNGLVLTIFDQSTVFMQTRDVAIQPNGKIVVAGQIAGTPVFALARYNADGSPDTGFGPDGNGLVPTPIPGGFFTFAAAMAIQTNGKILAAGMTCCTASSLDFVLLRYQGHEEEARIAQAGTGAVAQATSPGVPETYALAQNYPNPFNPATTIRFALPESAQVRLVVHDVLGRAMRVLVDGVREAGMHEAVFEAGNLPSGSYLVRLETPQGSFVRLMQLVK